MGKKLITSALPYVNNIPHLGNLIGSVLSADVFARYCRLKGDETLFVCGTDEYGTATEMKALSEKKTPQEICDHFHTLHREIYEWFEISFDIFGRTSTEKHKEIVPKIFLDLDKAAYILEKETEQFFDESFQIFLADRYLIGECPFCHFKEASGDQCDQCGRLLQPEQLIGCLSRLSKTPPIKKMSRHLYLDLPKLHPLLSAWLEPCLNQGGWSKNAIAITRAWLRDGLQARCISRDLKWGVPIPKVGFESKVFYVWFDAPIGYISITAQAREDWRDWWQNPKSVQLYQFMGKDNVPFHSIVFPSILLASSEASAQKWTLTHAISATEYLNYEDDKFSKSRGVGVFGNDARDSGISVDSWRYYLLSLRPEQQDTAFLWADFQSRVNNELLANFGNLVNRVLVFLKNKMHGQVPKHSDLSLEDKNFLNESQSVVTDYESAMDRLQLREALLRSMLYTKAANKYLQDQAPWKTLKTNPKQAKTTMALLLACLRNCLILFGPFLPKTRLHLLEQLNLTEAQVQWRELNQFLTPGHQLGEPFALFQHLENEQIEVFRARFSGKKQEI